ncbi:MAG: transporter [Candidatus Omnitrophica bacterium]|nr:transporter [Candidatus Omnitrophota bacterium]
MKKLLGILAGFAVFVLLIPGRAGAVGSAAFRTEVPDGEAMGKGSAFVGEADNPSAMYYNPAGMTQLKGNQVSTGLTVVQPFVDFHNTTTKVQMQEQSFILPHFYFVSDLNTDKFAFGISGNTNYGLGTAWNRDSFARYVTTDSDIVNINGSVGLAYKLTDNWSIGVAADQDSGTINKNKKLQQDATGDPANDGDFQIKGTSNIDWGYRLSTLYKINERHQIGLQYRSPIQKNYKSKVTLSNLNGFAGTNYQSIFNGSYYETGAELELELPQSVVMGYSYHPADKWRFNFDVEWTDWASITQERLDFSKSLTAQQIAVLYNGNPAARDWHSAWSGALGADYQWTDKVALRCGYRFLQSPIPEPTWEPNLPDSSSHSAALGLGYKINSNLTVDVAYHGMFHPTQTIEKTQGGTGATIDGKYTNFTSLSTVTVGYKF